MADDDFSCSRCYQPGVAKSNKALRTLHFLVSLRNTSSTTGL